MTPEKAPRQRGLVIVNKAERLIIDLAPHIDKIPKHQRYRYAVRPAGGRLLSIRQNSCRVTPLVISNGG